MPADDAGPGRRVAYVVDDDAAVRRSLALLLRSAGFSVQAYVTLEISQGALDDVARDLAAIPQVLEASVVTGSSDVLCKVATASHAELQAALVRLDQSAAVVRSTSVVVLSVLVEPRVLPLLETAVSGASRAPAYRAAAGGTDRPSVDGSPVGAEPGSDSHVEGSDPGPMHGPGQGTLEIRSVAGTATGSFSSR